MDPRCPTCGETERLAGSRAADDVEVTCQACGHRWMRGSPRCRACGGEDAVHKLQLMTRQPRGNQRAVVGHREVPLCPRCDADVVRDARDHRTIPEDYVSKFLFGRDEQRPAPEAKPPPPPAGSGPRTSPPPASRPAPPRQAPANRPTRPQRPPAPPTVRQAIDAFMTEQPGADPLTMLMLGRHLGAATRLQELDKPAAAASLQQWFREQWGDQPSERRDAAAAVLVAAVDYWRERGWLQGDLVDFLR